MEKSLIKNKRAFFDYEVLERFTAGIVLLGHEVKSLKNGGGHFTGSYITEKGGELFLEHFHIPLYKKSTLLHYEPERPRKLLLRKAEITKIASELHTAGVTIVPLECGLQSGKIKIDFALARGKKQYDKRESLKKKDTTRRIQSALKDY
ncbi:MAG: SsrA-binding protein SmpB [Candidatus Gracilibacteria bacterium]|jgi:SsrA-binding protein